MKLYYVYILCCSDGKLYTGMTNNIEKRIIEHNSGDNKKAYTYRRRPVQLVFYQDFIDVEQAIAFEKKIKKWSKLKKEALISGDFDTLKLLASCKNETNYRTYVISSGVEKSRQAPG